MLALRGVWLAGPMTDLLAGRLRVQLATDEGYRRWPYPDSQGHLTIGIGHKLSVPISDAAVEQIFRDDLADKVDGLRRRWPHVDRLSEARQGVCFNMAFNLGVEGFLRFKRMIAALEAEDYERAVVEMLDSEWATQVGARASRLAEQMRQDAWQ